MSRKQVRVHFAIADGPVRSESLWASEVRPGEYQLNNVPFFAYGVAMGDIVTVRKKDGRLWFAGVARSRGHSTIRILFSPEYASQDLLARLTEIGCRWERSFQPAHVAVDVPPTVGLDAAEALLQQPARTECLSYEVSAERTGPGNWAN